MQNRSWLILLPLLFSLVFIPGCASKKTDQANLTQETKVSVSSVETSATLGGAASDGTNQSSDEFSLDDYDDDEALKPESDPFEPWNRFWYAFNDVLLLRVLKPVHTLYINVVPEPIRNGVQNFSHNLLAPVRLLNFALQGDFGGAGVEFGRFVINSITSFGLADVASTNKNLFPYNPAMGNFGATLGRWGVPAGPYLILPFFGPSTVRGTLGFGVDSFIVPQNYIFPTWINLGSSTMFTFNNLQRFYGPYEQLTSMSLEPYIAVRATFMGYVRRNMWQ